MNFGGFATPERRLILDINDFDETLPGPWEWDVKRLATSFVFAARSNGFSTADQREAGLACVRSYREHMTEYADMSFLEIWYARLQLSDILCSLHDKAGRTFKKASPKGTSAHGDRAQVSSGGERPR